MSKYRNNTELFNRRFVGMVLEMSKAVAENLGLKAFGGDKAQGPDYPALDGESERDQHDHEERCLPGSVSHPDRKSVV